MHNHIVGRAGKAITLLVKRINRELDELVRYGLGGELLEINKVTGVQADLISELPELFYPAF
jgi:hypothetical protein